MLNMYILTFKNNPTSRTVFYVAQMNCEIKQPILLHIFYFYSFCTLQIISKTNNRKTL